MYTHQGSISETIRDFMEQPSKLEQFQVQVRKTAKRENVEKPKKVITYRQRLALHLGARQNQRQPQFIRNSEPGLMHKLRNLEHYLYQV